MCDVDAEPCAIWEEQRPRARKPYRCTECRGQIPVGVRHVRIGALSDGHWDTFRMHYECRVLWGSMAGDLCGEPGFVLVYGLDEELSQYEGDPAAEPYRLRFDEIRAKYAEASL